MATSTQQQLLPNFIPLFQSPFPPFYFHYKINAEEANLEVEVIGPNLRFTFRHSRAISLMGPSERHKVLDKRTVGFLTLVRGSDRHIVAWAESGHGAGRIGDLLDAPPGSPVLPNRVWTRRVVKLGTLLGFKMGSFFDKMGARGTTTAEDQRGIFRGSHVEVKLAAFAVCLMLKSFGITKDLDNIKRRQLRQLRQVRWKDGTRPSFEIYFSRKNCLRCGFLVKALADITGIPITLSWKDRLTPKIYEPIPIRPNKRKQRAITVEDNGVVDLNNVITIEDEDSDISIVDGSQAGSNDSAIVIDEDVEMMDLTTPTGSPVAGPERDAEMDGVGNFIDRMLEYARKVDSSPDNPVAGRLRRRLRVFTGVEEGPINKPLPATPVDEVPELNTTGELRSRPTPETPCPPPGERIASPHREENQQPVMGIRERSPRRYSHRRRGDGTYLSDSDDPFDTVRDKEESVIGVRERSPRRDQLKSGEDKNTFSTPGTPSEKTQGSELDFWGKSGQDETPCKAPVREDKRSPTFVIEIPARGRSRSSSPFDF
ncbi:hypothetical protein ACO1O0_007888 [Amphichorda felina]